jgi:hypothetical protein
MKRPRTIKHCFTFWVFSWYCCNSSPEVHKRKYVSVILVAQKRSPSSVFGRNHLFTPHPLSVLRIQDAYPGSEFFHPGTRVEKIRIRIKQFYYVSPIKVLLSRNMIWDFHAESQKQIFSIPYRIQASKKRQRTRIRICNIAPYVANFINTNNRHTRSFSTHQHVIIGREC